MSNLLRKGRAAEVVAAIMIYLVALLYQGYQYGVSDQSQILPCLWAQDHPGAYPKDHYVQTYLHSPFNERTIFHFLLRFLGYANPWIMFGWHALLAIALFWAWLRIAGLFIRNSFLRWLAIAGIVTLGYHFHTGSNEIYYNAVVPSLAAKALASWAIYDWLTGKSMRWAILLISATLLQPLVGLQLFLLCAMATFMQKITTKDKRVIHWLPFLLYLILIGPFLFLLLRYNGGSHNPDLFFNIIRFRLSHHFFASSFGWIHHIAGLFFAVVALRNFKKEIRWFILFALVGCIVYELGVEWKHLPAVLYSQWWKTTIWVEAFAFVGMASYVDRNVREGSKWLRYAFVYPILLIGLTGAYRLSGFFGTGTPYMFPWSKWTSPELDISLKAGQSTPEDALFIVPVEFTAFRWNAKRSTYVDYKAMLHQETFLFSWYDRMQHIYQYGIPEQEGGFELANFSKYLLAEPSFTSIEYWKSLGITHIISTTQNLKDLDLVSANGTYAIYKLK